MKKKKWIVFVIVAVLVYEVAGAVVPFVNAKQVQGELREESEFYSEETGTDRAAIIESNKDALDIRLSMFEEAKKSIVFSTFDIRDGKSTRDVFSSLLMAADRGVKVQIIVDGLYGRSGRRDSCRSGA